MRSRSWLAVTLTFIALGPLMFGTSWAFSPTSRGTVTSATDADDSKGFLDIASARVQATRRTFEVHIRTYDPFPHKWLVQCAQAGMNLPDTGRVMKIDGSKDHWMAYLIDTVGSKGVVDRTRVQHPFPRRLIIAFPTNKMGPARGVSKWNFNTVSTTAMCREHHRHVHFDALPETGFVSP